jgi:hypothetical protein
MTDTMTDDERKAFLAELGLDAEAPALAAEVVEDQPAKVKKAKAKKDVDPHTQEVSTIVFDPKMVEHFTLDASDMKQASDLLFQHYKSPTKGERNKFLHRRITEFLQQVKRQRNPQPRDGFIKGKVKAGKEERDLTQLIAQAGLTADDLAVMLEALAASKKG